MPVDSRIAPPAPPSTPEVTEKKSWIRRRRSRNLKKESQSRVDLDEAAEAVAAASELDAEDVALAKHRACEAIVIGEVARALGTNRSIDLLDPAKLLLHDFIEMAWLSCRREVVFVRQAGRAVVDMEAFEQHRITAV